MLYSCTSIRKVRLLLLIALFLTGLLLTQAGRWSATPAFAQTALVALQDTFVDPNNPATAYDSKRLEVAYSNFPIVTGSRRALLQFDLNGMADSLSTAPLLLTIVENNFPAGATLTLGLYGLADNWNESTVTFATLPTVGTQLQTISIMAGATGEIRFSAAAVGAYLEAQRTGDRLASLLLRIDGGSGTLGFGGNIFFEDSEGSSDGVNGNEPVIEAPATVPTATSTNTPTNTPTSTTVPATATSTNTPTNTTVPPTATSTNTPTSTTVPPTATSTNTSTSTTVPPTATSTNTPTSTTVPPTATSTNTPTSTTVPPTATSTNTPTQTPSLPTTTPTPTPPGTVCTPVAENLVQNGSFENGRASWVFYTNGNGKVALNSPAYDCFNAAKIQIVSAGSNVQLYQPNLTLEAGVRYRLRFAAYSSTGHDLGVYLQNHRSPYESYGLAVAQVDLGSGWQEYSLEFTASGFSGTAINARLRFWFAPFAQAGDLYWIDAVSLTKLSGDVATPTPTPTVTNTPEGPTATPTVTPTSVPCAPVANNLLVNGSFEQGAAGWKFHDPKAGSFTTGTPAYECEGAASIQINQFDDKIQLYQRGITLEANTQYRLQFAAYSNTGADLAIYLHNHISPYERYGMELDQVDLGTGWQFYTINFTTRGFSRTVNNARLRFWLAPFAQAGDVYWIDAVSLVKVSDLVTAQELSDETPIVVTNSGFLVGLTEAEFDPILLGLIADGNDVGEVQLENRIFLPLVNR